MRRLRMAFKDFLLGSKGGFSQLPRLTQQQQGLTQGAGAGANQLLQLLLNNLINGQGGIGGGFAPIAQRARTQFEQQTIPSIAERFTSMGAGAQSSPAFAQLLGQAGAGLEEGLAAQEAQYGLQQQNLLQSLLGNLFTAGLTPQFENVYKQSQPGFLQSILGPALQAGVGFATGNPMMGLSGITSGINALGRQAGVR